MTVHRRRPLVAIAVCLSARVAAPRSWLRNARSPPLRRQCARGRLRDAVRAPRAAPRAGTRPRAGRTDPGISRQSERGDPGAARLQGRGRRQGRPPEAGLVDQHHRRRPGPAHPRRQRAAAVHPADARQGRQGRRRPRRSSRRCPRRWASRGTTTASTCRAAGSRRRSPQTMDNPGFGTAERPGRPPSAARSEGRRQLHDGRHAAHVGRRRRRPQRSRHPRGARVAGRQALLHHQRQRRRPARRRLAELAAAQLRATIASSRCSARRPAGSARRRPPAASSPARPSRARTSSCSPAACATRCTSTGTPTARSSRSTATWSRSSACRGTGRCACSGCRAAPTSAIAATAASTRPGTRTRCRRSSRSASAARSA